MAETYFHVVGQLSRWPSKVEMASLLRKAGLRICVGSYSIRIEDCTHFVIQEYAGDFTPYIDAHASTIEEITRDASLVSNVLAESGIRHRFSIYDDYDVCVGYVHHDWPQT